MMGARLSDLELARDLEAVAIDVARLAANHVRSRLGAARATNTKSSPTDIVTDTDLEAERLIRNELSIRSPRSTVVGEELGEREGSSEIGWIVDPIDGTINFLYDLPVVSVSVAATRHGIVVAGAVTDVLRDKTFSAARDGGARIEGAAIAVSEADDLATSLVGTGFSYDAGRRAHEAAVLSRVLPRARDVRCFGSAALHLCWVGCGRLDAYYQRNTEIYDSAAGALIAAEAGAAVEHPVDNDEALLIAATPLLMAPIRSLVASRPPR